MRYEQHSINDDGWTPYFYPKMDGWKMSCCDCGLVHKFRFVIQEDQVGMSAFRDNRATAQKRRHIAKATGGE